MARVPERPSIRTDAANNPPEIVVATLSDVDLIAFLRRAMFAAGLAPRFSFRRRRWRRFHHATSHELGARLRSHNASGLCDLCEDRSATHHQIRDGADGPAFEHHCATCVGQVTPGWYGMVTRKG